MPLKLIGITQLLQQKKMVHLLKFIIIRINGVATNGTIDAEDAELKSSCYKKF